MAQASTIGQVLEAFCVECGVVRTATYIISFMEHLGEIGFADQPQFPGFTVAPFAVYRTIPTWNIAEELVGNSPVIRTNMVAG